jgi:hypothetical protein
MPNMPPQAPQGPITPAGAPPVAPAVGAPRRGREKPVKAGKQSKEEKAKAVREGVASSRKIRAAKKPPRVTSLQLKRIDPWTVLKISLIVSIVMFFVWMIAVGLLYVLFSSLDVVSRINAGWATVTSADSSVTPSDLITAGKVFGIAAVIGAINIVILTALATVSSFVYNAAAGMAGGVELTLGERD